MLVVPRLHSNRCKTSENTCMCWWGSWCSISAASWDKVPGSSITLNPKFPCVYAHATLGAGESCPHGLTYLSFSERHAASPVTGCTSHRLLCSLPSADVAVSPDVPSQESVFIAGFHCWKIAAAMGRRRRESRGSCHCLLLSLCQNGAPQLQTAVQHKGPAKVSSAWGWLCSASPPGSPQLVWIWAPCVDWEERKFYGLQDSHVLEWLAAGTRWLGFFFFF